VLRRLSGLRGGPGVARRSAVKLLRWSCGCGMGRQRGLSAQRGWWVQAVALGRACSGLPPAWWDAAHAVGSGQILLGLPVSLSHVLRECALCVELVWCRVLPGIWPECVSGEIRCSISV
jgi:hypothetical protein